MADKAHILDQLRNEKAFFKYDYGNSTLDPWLTDELSRLIASTGVNDIRDIQFFSDFVPFTDVDGITNYQWSKFYYDALTGNIIQGIGGKDFDPRYGDDVFAATQNADFKFVYHIRYNGTTPYFVVSVEALPKGGGSWVKQFAQGIAPILPVIMLAANFFAPGIATAIGNAVLGPLGVTSTALASTLGNIAIGTVTSGGDVEGAVKGALLGNLGSSIGQFVGGNIGNLVDSDMIAKATAAATSAAITGGDIKTAAAGSLLPSGVQAVSDFFGDLFPSNVMDNNAQVPDFSQPVDMSTGLDFSNSEPLFPGTLDGTFGGSDPTGDLSTVSLIDVTGGDLSVPDIPVYTDTPPVVVAPDGGSSSNWLANLSQLALAAIKVTTAYQQAGKPPVRISGTTANGQTVIANPNGTVTVNGKTALPPVGVPYVTPQGAVVVNNGDGTYTKVDNSGVTATNHYTTSSTLFGGIDQKTLLIGGAVLIAFLVLR